MSPNSRRLGIVLFLVFFFLIGWLIDAEMRVKMVRSIDFVASKLSLNTSKGQLLQLIESENIAHTVSIDKDGESLITLGRTSLLECLRPTRIAHFRFDAKGRLSASWIEVVFWNEEEWYELTVTQDS